MKRRCALAAAAVLALFASMMVAVAPSATAAVGLHVSGRNIVEANGSNFIMRGAAHAHVWFQNQTSSFANIKSLGANVVRVVLSGGRWTPANGAADVANIVSLCKQNRLICVLENHDTTGFGEQGGAVSLDSAVNYWLSVQSALTGQENYVVINIGNEPIGNNAVTPGWAQATTSAITRLRDAGFQHLLMVDAPNWGQDWQFTMRDSAAGVFNADPQRNTVFSVHMYGVYDTAAEINSYMDAFRTAGLPLVVGEFGINHTDGNPDEDTIMAQAQARGLGYIGWSWSGNSSEVAYLDMVNNFNVASLTPWGQRIFNGANGIAATAKEATIFSGGGGGGGGGDTTAPTTPGTPTAAGVTATGATLSWPASTDSGGSGLAGYNVYREQGTTDPLLGQAATNSIALTGLTAGTRYQVYVRARDGAGNLSGNSALVTFTTSAGGGGGGGGGGACRVTYSTNTWSTGLTANITIANTSTAAINGWTLAFTLPGGQAITSGWNATYTPATGQVTAANVSYNGTINPGQSTGIGFQATHTGNTAAPTAFTLNNTACAIA